MMTEAGAPATEELPVAVIGAGPVGLAAAAHLLEQGLEPLVLERGEAPGAAVAGWGHIRLFSPWRYALDAASVRLLEAHGWRTPRPTALPYGRELVEQYLIPLAETPALAGRIQFGRRVAGISRGSRDKTHSSRRGAPFVVRTEGAEGPEDLYARAVVDASGTWRSPNPAGASGLPALGEEDAAVAPFLLGPLPDVFGAERHRTAEKHVLVTGGGHSAANTLLNLVALRREAPGTRITWAIRGGGPERAYGGGDADGLPERGALGQRLRRAVEAGLITLMTSASVQELSPDQRGGLSVRFADGRRLRAGALAAATGFRPDLDIIRELRTELDPGVEAPPRLAPLIDPEHHSCGTVPAHGADVLAHPEEGFFIAGMKSYGRAPTFLLATGYEQVRSIAAHLAGRDASVRDLDLPETGVCSGVDPEGSGAEEAAAQQPAQAGCCGSGPEPVSLGVPTGLQHGRLGL